MKKALFLLFVPGLLILLDGCKVHISSSNWSGADLTAVTNVVRSAAIPAGLKNLQVHNRFGNVYIVGTTDDQAARWTWKLTVRARSDSTAQTIVEGTSCKAELEGGRLNLVVSFPDINEPHSIQSDLEIRVPKTAAVNSQNQFGRTEIADLAGNVEAVGENGSLEIRDIQGEVHARTSFSSLTASNIGPAVLRNRNGEIRAATIAGTLEAATSFASLRARNIGGPAVLSNQNGRIQADGVAGSLDAKTSFSDLSAKEIDGPVRLRNRNGSINLSQDKGDADLETSFASLKVEDVRGDAILVNQNGGVRAKGITGSVRASTSFAPLEVTGNGRQFSCQNRNGAIHLRATSEKLTNLVAQTSFAPLELRLPAGMSPSIRAHTTFADVESDFPVLLKPTGEEPLAEAAPDTVRINLQNQNGRIRVLRERSGNL